MSWLSIGLGVGLGLLFALASHLTHRLAAGTGDRRFFRIVIGGVVARLIAAASLVVLVLSLVPVDVAQFAVSFLVVFSAGMAREIRWLHRHPDSAVPGNG
jgi:hypothetical protein